jgi:hypothetical protein
MGASHRRVHRQTDAQTDKQAHRQKLDVTSLQVLSVALCSKKWIDQLQGVCAHKGSDWGRRKELAEAQTLSRRLPTAATRVRHRSKLALWWPKGTDACFLLVLQFPYIRLRLVNSSTDVAVIQGWYSSPVYGCGNRGVDSTTPPFRNKIIGKLSS